MSNDGESPGGPDRESCGAVNDRPTASGLPAKPARRELLPLPGLAAIALYMLVLSGINIVGVVDGYIGPLFLVFSAAFIAAGLGLLLLFRWAWTMTAAAMVLLMGLFAWKFYSDHDFASIAQALLNAVFFLYLVRPEVRAHLR